MLLCSSLIYIYSRLLLSWSLADVQRRCQIYSSWSKQDSIQRRKIQIIESTKNNGHFLSKPCKMETPSAQSNTDQQSPLRQTEDKLKSLDSAKPPFWYLFRQTRPSLIASNEVGKQKSSDLGIPTPRTRQESREEQGSLSLVREDLSAKAKEGRSPCPRSAGKQTDPRPRGRLGMR